jgi:hypothetical protein
MSGKKKASTKSIKSKGEPKATATPAGTEGATRETTKGEKPQPKAKAVRAPKPAKPPRVKRVSALDAAAKLLAGASKPMSAGDLIEQMEAKKLWTSPGGKTPDATLSAAIGREIKALGKDARFKKADRGLFSAGKVVAP